MRRGMMDKAPDYTNAALIMGLVNLIWIFFVLWAVVGFWSILVSGWVLNRLILRLGQR